MRIRSGARKILSPFAEIREHLRNLLSRPANQIESPPEHQGGNVLCGFDGKLVYRKRANSGRLSGSWEGLAAPRVRIPLSPPVSLYPTNLLRIRFGIARESRQFSYLAPPETAGFEPRRKNFGILSLSRILLGPRKCGLSFLIAHQAVRRNSLSLDSPFPRKCCGHA